MDSLKTLVRQVLEAYAGPAVNGVITLTISPDETTYVLTGVGVLEGRRFVNTGILVRIEYDTIIIERDQSDKPVVDALVQAGAPRGRIVCAYAGEPLPSVAL